MTCEGRQSCTETESVQISTTAQARDHYGFPQARSFLTAAPADTQQPTLSLSLSVLISLPPTFLLFSVPPPTHLCRFHIYCYPCLSLSPPLSLSITCAPIQQSLLPVRTGAPVLQEYINPIKTTDELNLHQP